jgi:hypothetical protein
MSRLEIRAFGSTGVVDGEEDSKVLISADRGPPAALEPLAIAEAGDE